MTAQPVHVLALNSGSSSLKFGLYRMQGPASEALISGEAESIGAVQSSFAVQGMHQNALLHETTPLATHQEAIIRIVRLLRECGTPAPDAVGHRVVHGGPNLLKHCLIDATVLQQLSSAVVFAPLHTPPALCVIRYALEQFPNLPHAACFDTSFHADLPLVARVLPLAREWQRQGVRRYGFHGLSCESIVRQLGADLPQRLVIAHLGNGSSVTAVRSGQSVDTSMGLTPTGGVMMGTRSGDIDPGVLLYLLREKHFDAAMLEALVDHHAGLLGVSGVSNDMRKLRTAAPANADATLAIDMYCYSVRKQIAAMIAVLDGADLIVFTGGIGEHDAQARAAICHGLACMGVSLDVARNRAAHDPISAAGSRAAVRVFASQEDAQIAHHTSDLSTR